MGEKKKNNGEEFKTAQTEKVMLTERQKQFLIREKYPNGNFTIKENLNG